jgi:hypothetical protein
MALSAHGTAQYWNSEPVCAHELMKADRQISVKDYSAAVCPVEIRRPFRTQEFVWRETSHFVAG